MPQKRKYTSIVSKSKKIKKNHGANAPQQKKLDEQLERY
jgi:hypothetical protein